MEYNQGEICKFCIKSLWIPKEEFAGFKEFLGSGEGFDIDVLMEQMTSELLWNKLFTEKLTSNIVISRQEIEKVYNDRMQNLGSLNTIFQKFHLKMRKLTIGKNQKKKWINLFCF